MRKFITGVLLVALACVPTLAQAEVTRAPQAPTSQGPGTRLTQAVPVDDGEDSARDYAARQAAAPQLAGFAGGSGGIYIGTGALVVALIVVIVVLVVH